MWAIPTGIRCQLAFKKKKIQVKSPSPESRVPETGSDPPIGSARDSRRDMVCSELMFPYCQTEHKYWETNVAHNSLNEFMDPLGSLWN